MTSSEMLVKNEHQALVPYRFAREKRVIIEDDESIITMQLLEYSISSLESHSPEDGDSIVEGLPTLSFLLSVSSIVLIAIASRVRID